MTATTTSAGRISSDSERLAFAGFLAGYSGLTQEA
jgi:hypothetical protein